MLSLRASELSLSGRAVEQYQGGLLSRYASSGFADVPRGKCFPAVSIKNGSDRFDGVTDNVPQSEIFATAETPPQALVLRASYRTLEV